MHVRLVSKVYSDLESAMAFYEREAGSQTAVEFYEEFSRCVQVLVSRPLAFPVIEKEIRRINFHRSPFHILYQIVDERSLKILVVKHDRRDPDFGLDR